MKKSRLLWISIIVFVGIVAVILIYNYYLISPNISYAGFDKFRIKEIYPTKTGGEEWFMNMDRSGCELGFKNTKTSTTERMNVISVSYIFEL